VTTSTEVAELVVDEVAVTIVRGYRSPGAAVRGKRVPAPSG
jgi:hypothetical protein